MMKKKLAMYRKVVAAAAAVQRQQGRMIYSRDDGTCVQDRNTVEVGKLCPERKTVFHGER